MSRYIDAEPLEHRSPKLKALILEQPTVDVEPVRHGKWIKDEYGLHCSECGESANIDSERHYVKTNYCSNCGAKMDKI